MNTEAKSVVMERDLATLLEKIWRGKALSAASTRLLLDIMHRCLTSGNRIRAMLPPETPVADKTGTLGGGARVHGAGTQNDAGIIDLPDSAGHVITVVFVKGEDDEKRGERAIAQIARAAYDYFLTNPGRSSEATGAAARR